MAASQTSRHMNPLFVLFRYGLICGQKAALPDSFARLGAYLGLIGQKASVNAAIIGLYLMGNGRYQLRPLWK